MAQFCISYVITELLTTWEHDAGMLDKHLAPGFDNRTWMDVGGFLMLEFRENGDKHSTQLLPQSFLREN